MFCLLPVAHYHAHRPQAVAVNQPHVSGHVGGLHQNHVVAVQHQVPLGCGAVFQYYQQRIEFTRLLVDEAGVVEELSALIESQCLRVPDRLAAAEEAHKPGQQVVEL